MDDFKIQLINDVAVVTVDILVATHRDAKPFWDELEKKAILDWDKVIIDVSHCTFIDSTFLGIIVKIYKRINENKGKLILVFPEERSTLFFHTIGITKFIKCYNVLWDAINSFDSNIPTRNISFQALSK